MKKLRVLDSCFVLLPLSQPPHHDTVICRFDGETSAIEFVGSIVSRWRPVQRGQMVVHAYSINRSLDSELA